MTVRSSLMPRTSCGAPMAFRVFHGGRRLGLDLHRRRALERRVCRLACLQARRPLRRPAADLHGACRAVWLDRGRRGSGAGLADGSRLPVSVGPLHQPDQVLGHPAVLRLRRRAPDQRRRRAVQSHAEGNRSSMVASTATSRSCGTPSATSSNSTMPSGSSKKKRLPEPRSSSSGVARRDLNQARRVRQTCVQGTGCATCR